MPGTRAAIPIRDAFPAAPFRSVIRAGMLPRRLPASSESPHESATGSSTEGHLLAQARRGNRSAVNTLFDRYRPWLRRWARGRLPAWVRDGIDTSDVVHDALCRTFVRLESFQSNRASALRAYLQRAVENRIHDQLRRAQRRSNMSIRMKPSGSPAVDHRGMTSSSTMRVGGTIWMVSGA